MAARAKVKRNPVTTAGREVQVAPLSGAVRLQASKVQGFDFAPDEARRLARALHAAADVLDPPVGG